MKLFEVELNSKKKNNPFPNMKVFETSKQIMFRFLLALKACKYKCLLILVFILECANSFKIEEPMWTMMK